MKVNSKQLFTKSKATTTPLSLQSSQLSHLETANQRLNKILDEVVELTKSLKFTLRNYQYKRRFKSSKN